MLQSKPKNEETKDTERERARKTEREFVESLKDDLSLEKHSSSLSLLLIARCTPILNVYEQGSLVMESWSSFRVKQGSPCRMKNACRGRGKG